MTTADNVRRLDDAMAERGQPIPISTAEMRQSHEDHRNAVLDRLAVVRTGILKDDQQIADLQDHKAALLAEAKQLEAIADAQLTTIHAFDRIGQGRV